MERLGSYELEGRLEKVVKRAKSTTGRLLSRHPDLISSKKAKKIIDMEAKFAMDGYLIRRKAGLANDGYSKEPGMSIFLTEEGRERLEKIGRRKHFDVNSKDFEGMKKGTAFVDFPNGVFAMPDEGALFSATTTKEGHTRKQFYLPYKSIIRVEGKTGELWQNKAFNWDGSKKV